MKSKAQTSVEMIVLLAVSIIVIGSIIQISTTSMSNYGGMMKRSESESVLNKVSSAADMVYYQGYGAMTKIFVQIPEGLKNISISEKTITLEFLDGRTAYRNFDFYVAGELPIEAGGYWVQIESHCNMVLFGDVSEASFEVCFRTIRSRNILQLWMDEQSWTGTGSVIDSSGNDRHFTKTGNAQTAPDGMVERGGIFSGGYISDEDAESYLNGLSEFTISFWIKSQSTMNDNGIFFASEPTNNDNRLGMRYVKGCRTGPGKSKKGCIAASISTTQGIQVIESSINRHTTAWQHIVLRWSSGESLEMFINGQRETLTYANPAVGGTTNAATKLLIGRGAKPQNWHGMIDEFYIWDRKLTDQEIMDVHELKEYCMLQSCT